LSSAVVINKGSVYDIAFVSRLKVPLERHEITLATIDE